jgi:alpha-L-rhamnosidase
MNIIPLSFGITPIELREKVMQRVLDDIAKNEDHLTTGFLGTTFLIPELSKHGHDEVAYRIMTQRGYPSFGRIIDAGATTITEAWNAYLGEDFASHNHFNLGSVTEWFFSGLAGIQPHEEIPGFKKFIIKTCGA